MYGISYILLRSTAASTRPSPRRHGDCTGVGLPGPEQRNPSDGLGASWPARSAGELGFAERDGGREPPTSTAAATGGGTRRRTAAPVRGGRGNRRRAVVAAPVVGPPAADTRPRRPAATDARTS